MKKMTTLRFIAFWLCMLPLFCTAQDRYNDSLALVALYNSTNGTNWTNSWNLTQTMDTWYGVGLNESGRVDFLDISSNELSGNIPTDIGNLTDLGALDLYSNQLTGNIPSEIGNLTNLVRLWMSDNQLTGNIPPEIENMTSLITVILSGNQLSGEIPVEITNLAAHHLTYLSLGRNQLSGNIPPEFGNMTNLIGLSMENNQLTGNIPPEIGNMTNLEGINLSGNQLSGSIPPEIGNATNLIDLYLVDCGLSGSIPVEIGNLVNLRAIFAQNNQFTGSIPTSIGNLTNLQALYLFNNQITGNIPTSIGNLTNLKELRAGNNQLSGNLPESIGNIDSLRVLSLTSNELTGSIPVSIGNLSKLTALGLTNNELTGSIPVSIENLSKLTTLSLANNELTGSIPSELGNMTNLTNIDLSTNQLSGSIPSNIGNLTDLKYLILYHNELSGNIPAEVSNLMNIKWLWIGGNNLTDTIPNLENLTQLERLDVAYNDLSGDFPNLGSSNLEILQLQSNQITGNIPSIIGSLTGLTTFNITYNQISGDIPNFSGSSNLGILHLNHNKFSHEDIAANYDSNSSVSDFVYSPQYYGTEQFHTDTVGAEVVLSPAPSILYENPSIKWFQNDWYITPEYTFNDTTYIIPSLDTMDIGRYQYRFIDSTLTPLVEFHSLPINNYVEGLDLEGKPVIKGELIIEYGRDKTWVYIDSVRTELMSSKYKGTIIDSCGCAVSIDLWRFGADTIDIVQEILGTDARERRTSADSGIDGGQNRANIFAPDYAVGEQILVSPHTSTTNDTASLVIIGVIDTGINTNHMKIQPNLWTNPDHDSCYPNDIHGFDFIQENEMSDGHGHGTKIGGVIAANIPGNMNIRVLPVKTFDDEGQGTLFNLICGIYYAIEKKADIINISAGYKGEQSNILRRALQYGRNKNISFVVASGNDTLNLNTDNYWPGTFSRDSTLLNTVFTVTAVDTDHIKLDYANYGDTTVTIAAYGQGIYAPSNIGNENYEYISGTSISTALVSLALAIEKLQAPNRSYSTLKADFLSNMSTAPNLINQVKGGYVLDASIQKLSKLKVFLQGAVSADSDSMRTSLNERGLLPGQTPLNPLTEPTIEGQPYDIAPWNYTGTEWENIRNYVNDRVDWILVSLRTEVTSDTEVYRTAAQVRNDGAVIFYRPVLDLEPMPDSVYIVIEHRSHMTVMSPHKIPITDDRIIYDFTKQDSYKDITSYGQIEIKEGVWAMYAGDSAQENDFLFYDINGDDKAIWTLYNGTFDKYLSADYNLDGDTNGEDKIFWEQNNGISNRVPK